MRGELEDLCVGKAWWDERAEGLSVRVAMLEESEAGRVRRGRGGAGGDGDGEEIGG